MVIYNKILKKICFIFFANFTLASAIASLECFDDHIMKQCRIAEQGNVQAQNQLGVMYAYGLGVPKDEIQALKWFLRAAAQNDIQAECNIGILCINLNSKIGSYADAAQWFTKAANHGSITAENYLGMMYMNGLGYTKNYIKAFQWYRKAALRGHAEAQNNLANMFACGLGISQNEASAVKWYRKALKRGYSNALENINSLVNLSTIRTTPTMINSLSLSNHNESIDNFKRTIQRIKLDFYADTQPFRSDFFNEEDYYLIDSVLTDLINAVSFLKDESFLKKGCLISTDTNHQHFCLKQGEQFSNRCIIVLKLFEDDQLFMSIGKKNVQKSLNFQQTLFNLKSKDLQQTIDSYINIRNCIEEQLKNEFFKNSISFEFTLNIKNQIEDNKNKIKFYESLKGLYGKIKELIMIDTIFRNNFIEQIY